MNNNNIYYLAQNKNNYKKYNYKNNKKRKRVFLFFLLILILIFVFSYKNLKDNRVVMITSDFGEVVDGFSTKALIVRNEKIYYAPESGYVNFLISEGNRAAYGHGIARINSRILYNYHPGLVSFALDGLEEDLSFNMLDGITVDNFFDYKRNYKQIFDNDYIRQGQAVFRIIDNNDIYIVVLTNCEEIDRYRVGEKVFIQAEEFGDRIIEAVIANKKVKENKGLLIININIFLKEWLNLRWADITFIKNIYRGVVIPRKAIFTSPEGEGVLIYSSTTGNYRFSKIQVMNGNEEMVVVNGINIGEKVIINPENINYGREV